MTKSIILLATAALCTACAFKPEVATKQPYANSCEMNTKQLTLTPMNIANNLHCNGHTQDALACLLIQGVIAPVGSFIVSGSIVAVNNTIHWLEYQGSCDTDVIVEKTDALKDEVNLGRSGSSGASAPR